MDDHFPCVCPICDSPLEFDLQRNQVVLWCSNTECEYEMVAEKQLILEQPEFD